MVIIIYDNFIVSPSLASVEEVLALKIMRISSSRITKKNQFIERIVGLALKRKRGSKEFIPYSLFEASKARDTGSSRCPTITLSI